MAELDLNQKDVAKYFGGENRVSEVLNGKRQLSLKMIRNLHKNLGISYPNKNDIANANRMGKSAGGNIKIHGLPNNFGFISKFHRWIGFTYGCIMVTNEEIDELYKAVKIGSKIEIKP
jgi:murein L,D-transpeptidase YafK